MSSTAWSSWSPATTPPSQQQRADDVAPSTIAVLLDRYERGDWPGIGIAPTTVAAINGAARNLRRDGPAWMKARGAAAEHRRRLAAASFALELLGGPSDERRCPGRTWSTVVFGVPVRATS